MSINGKLPRGQMPPSRYSASYQCTVSFGSGALWLLAFPRVGGVGGGGEGSDTYFPSGGNILVGQG